MNALNKNYINTAYQGFYEIYPNDYWMKQALDKNTGKYLKIPAKALIMNKETKTGKWERVLVHA